MNRDELFRLVVFAVVLGFVIEIVMFSRQAKAQYNWQDNPYNWKNSEYNWQNSPNNYNNSPYNPKNSEYNYNSPNGVYDSNGNRVGYVTQTPEGTKNYFSNNGERIGYGRTK
jgi:hypothetical protein